MNRREEPAGYLLLAVGLVCSDCYGDDDGAALRSLGRQHGAEPCYPGDGLRRVCRVCADVFTGPMYDADFRAERMVPDA